MGQKGDNALFLSGDESGKEEGKKAQAQQCVDGGPACIDGDEIEQHHSNDDDDEPAQPPVGKTAATFVVIAAATATAISTAGGFFVFIIIIATFVGAVSAVAEASTAKAAADAAVEVC